MKASVIIPTYNRGPQMEGLLSSLEQQSFPAHQFEVIVVDDGSTDGTRKILDTWSRKKSVTLKSIHQENRGPGAARNRGAEEAKGEVLVFVDSDCWVPRDWLECLLGPFQSPNVRLVGGSELPHPEDSFLSRCFWYAMNSKWTTGGIRGNRGRKLGKYYPRSFNMAVLLRDFKKVGGFQQAAIYGEDIELSYLIKGLGGKAAFADMAKVFHRKKMGFIQFAGQVFRIGRARFWLGRKYPPLAEPVYFLPALWLLSFVGASFMVLFGPLAMWGGSGPTFLNRSLFPFGSNRLFSFQNTRRLFPRFCSRPGPDYRLWGWVPVGNGKCNFRPQTS